MTEKQRKINLIVEEIIYHKLTDEEVAELVEMVKDRRTE